jgi:ATP-binding protein involved in chromosome partitioning
LLDTVSIHEIEAEKKLKEIGGVILVGSGKGGVGKSFVASGLALALSAKPLRIGILDLDIHGASLPNYLDVRPPVKSGKNGITPKLVGKLKVMSVALFTGNNPVPIRGNKKQELIAQLFSLTDWGRLDYLVVDLPPSTGDELLAAFKMFAGKCSLILVTTPSPNAVGVVSRLRKMADSERVPVKGIAVNMAFATKGKAKMPIFGKLDRKGVEKELQSNVIAEIPLEPKVNSKSLKSLLSGQTMLSRTFKMLAGRVVDE